MIVITSNYQCLMWFSMIYYYDGSIDGLFTVIFEKYKEIGKCEIKTKTNQMNFLESEIIKTNLVKSERVITSVRDNVGKDFFENVFKVFKSKHPKKEEIIAITIKSSLIYGNAYLTSAKKSAVKFNRIVHNFNHETHAYKGFTRFREIQDEYLLAEITPENDILIHLTLHFLKRMPAEKFIIYDKNRQKASVCEFGSYEELEILEMDAVESQKEVIFKDAWRGFYDAIGIDERKNKNLMQANMPKKYWKYLPEKN